MKAKVTAHMGDIFEGGADLTVLPCGAKPTWTTTVTRRIEQFGLPTPKDLMSIMRLSDVTPPAPFPGPQNITKFIAYGASVLNDHTSPEIIKNLGANIGSITRSHPHIRTIESVLFGTGHGKLADAPAARALSDGFKETADPSATLWIFVHSSARHANVRRAIESGLIRRSVNSLMLNPNWMGVGINLKKLFRLEE